MKTFISFCLLLSSSVFLFSCSESDEENSEFVNWQSRNDAFVVSLAKDSLASSHSNYQWRRLKSYSLDETTE